MVPRNLTRRVQKIFSTNTQRCCVCKQPKEDDEFPETDVHIEALGKQDICRHCYHSISDNRILHTN